MKAGFIIKNEWNNEVEVSKSGYWLIMPLNNELGQRYALFFNPDRVINPVRILTITVGCVKTKPSEFFYEYHSLPSILPSHTREYTAH
jgi:hypothetical protein